LLGGRNGNAVDVLVKRVTTIETFGVEEETASKYHQSKTVVLMGRTLGSERIEWRLEGVVKVAVLRSGDGA
jgi:hypothetical protein